jgi:hypothetical protein
MSNCTAFTFGVVFFWCYLAFALRSGRVYGAGPGKPTYRSESPVSYWFMVLMLAGVAFFLTYLRYNCE